MKTQEIKNPTTEHYPNLDFSQDELRAVMRKNYDDLIAFVTSPPFKAFHKELMSLPAKDRPPFVIKVLFSQEELKRRGITVPKGVLIQTSAFGDRRPTLFAVKKLLPAKYQRVWENVNLTFDNEYKDHEVPRDVKNAWRAPLPVVLQNTVMAAGMDLQQIPEGKGVKFGMYAPKGSPSPIKLSTKTHRN